METLITVLAIPLMNAVIERAKTKFSIEGKIALVLVALLLGVMYALFQYFVPEVFQQHVIDFVAKAGLGAVFVYEYLIKNMQK